LHVLIVGGGIGGLCLAQGLHKAGVSVAVYERDRSPRSRTQGYRLRISPAADAALRQCLPSNLYQLYLATSDKLPSDPVVAPDGTCNATSGKDRAAADSVSSRIHVAVSRETLRQVLLGNLYHIVHFDHTMVNFEQFRHRARIRFANGGIAVGDVLIAADGVNSLVRRRLLPHAELMDTGLRCIYGKTLLGPEAQAQIWEPLLSCGFTSIVGSDGEPLERSRVQPGRRAGLLFSTFRPRRPVEEAVNEFAPDVNVERAQDYLTWIVVASRGAYEIGDEELNRADAPTLHGIALDVIQGWRSNLRRLLELAEVPAVSLVPIYASRPVSPWPTSNVTFMGDAIHVMPPAGGAGANTALRDAAFLSRQLTAAARGELKLLTAIEQYEVCMREYGFAAVEQSLRKADRWFRLLQ
jgi:salicylate hydroxylase